MLNLIKEAKHKAAGIKGKIFAIPHADIETWPALETDKKQYVGDFGLVAGKTWGILELSRTSGEYNHAQENAGSTDNPSKNETVSVFYPGVNATTAKLLDDGEGIEWVLLIPSKNNCSSDTPIFTTVGEKCGGLDLVSLFSNDGSKMGYSPTWTGPASGLPTVYVGDIVT